ncbi:hypothetical protein R1sor_009068 [Riccia sorocarpa]|uniref:Reverse transcriptase zinc-binding domain-containing protein n=1 Tax=Riccia sorocarpa TaxID=122646 RepID=A0ABD3HAR1_9MARC
MPLAPTGVPAWVWASGCRVATPGVQFKYLGVLASCPVDEAATARSIVQKTQGKLNHWSNKLLSWPTKTLLLKHVLAATPLYQMMSVGLSEDGIEDLERLCRQFLWGWNDQGDPRTSLVAWDRVAQPTWNGGLGWTPIKDRARAMHIKSSLKKGGIQTVQEGLVASLEGPGWVQQIRAAGHHPEQEIINAVEHWESWLSSQMTVQHTEGFLTSWRWTDNTVIQTWRKDFRFWVTKFHKIRDYEELLNHKWGISNLAKSWKWRWNCLWAAPISYRKKIWWWKVLQRGFFTGCRAREMTVSTGICERCRETEETLEHLFWSCRIVRPWISALYRAGMLLGSSNTLMESIDTALERAAEDPSYIGGLGLLLEKTWKERNEKVFRKQLSVTPAAVLLKELAVEIEAFPTSHISDRKLAVITKAKETISQWRSRVGRIAPGDLRQ